MTVLCYFSIVRVHMIIIIMYVHFLNYVVKKNLGRSRQNCLLQRAARTTPHDVASTIANDRNKQSLPGIWNLESFNG